VIGLSAYLQGVLVDISHQSKKIVIGLSARYLYLAYNNITKNKI
jgi:hypothetical protein